MEIIAKDFYYVNRNIFFIKIWFEIIFLKHGSMGKKYVKEKKLTEVNGIYYVHYYFKTFCDNNENKNSNLI